MDKPSTTGAGAGISQPLWTQSWDPLSLFPVSIFLSFWVQIEGWSLFFSKLVFYHDFRPFVLNSWRKGRGQFRTTQVRYVYQGFVVRFWALNEKIQLKHDPGTEHLINISGRVSNHSVFFVGRVAIFTPSLPPKKHHIPPFPQQKFLWLALVRVIPVFNLGT